MIRFLFAWLGMPFLLTLLNIMPVRSPVLKMETRQSAELAALKARVEMLQERTAALNQKLAVSIEALESEPRKSFSGADFQDYKSLPARSSPLRL